MEQEDLCQTLLYLQDENCTYQIFLEPKGDHLKSSR